jgi:hypothetical protein
VPKRAADGGWRHFALATLSNFRKALAFSAGAADQGKTIPRESKMAKAFLAAISISFALLVAAFVYAAFTL